MEFRGWKMVDSRQKGARGETVARDALRKLTGLQWERTPGSGALNAKHSLKGDLYVPNSKNNYCVEVKNYEEDHLTSKYLTDKTPQITQWWAQTVRESAEVQKLPLLIFKFNRSKLFVAFQLDQPREILSGHMYLSRDKIWVMLLEDFVKEINPQWV